jgi:hypothetical protein
MSAWICLFESYSLSFKVAARLQLRSGACFGCHSGATWRFVGAGLVRVQVRRGADGWLLSQISHFEGLNTAN